MLAMGGGSGGRLGVVSWGAPVRKLIMLISMGGGVVREHDGFSLTLFLNPSLQGDMVQKVCYMGKSRALNAMVHSKSAENEF